MAKIFNLARMTTATAGTGTITLGTSVSGFLSFAQAGVADGDLVDYAINDGVNSEIGTGVYTASGTTLTRNVDNSTNSNTAIALSGSAQVFISPRAATLGVGAIEFIIDNGAVAITTGLKGFIEVPFSCTILRATLLADQSGSIVVDIWKDTYANFPPTVADKITASAPLTISASTKVQDAALTGWTKSISAGDILAYNVNSVSTIQRVVVSLQVQK